MHADRHTGRRARRSDSTTPLNPKPSNKYAHTQVLELKHSVLLYALKTEGDFAPIFWFLMCKILDAYVLEVYICLTGTPRQRKCKIWQDRYPKKPGVVALGSGFYAPAKNDRDDMMHTLTGTHARTGYTHRRWRIRFQGHGATWHKPKFLVNGERTPGGPLSTP